MNRVFIKYCVSLNSFKSAVLRRTLALSKILNTEQHTPLTVHELRIYLK